MSAVSRQCVPYGTFMTNSADSRATISGESGNNQLVERRRISSSLTQNQMNSFAKYTQQKPIDFFANRSCDDRVEYIFRDFESDSDHQEAEEQLEYRDQETFCYLCSIHAHVHKPTQPVPLSKRRFLRPYTNPLQLMKKYEQSTKNQITMKTKYKFLIKTGSGTNTGTNANVFFKLYGSAGTWNQTELKVDAKSVAANSYKFAPDSVVEINLVGPVIGDLKRLKIWHDGKSIKDAWYLDFVEIVCYELEQSWRFICDRWLSTHRAPEYSSSAMLSLTNNIFDNNQIRDRTDYILMIKTSRTRPMPNSDQALVQFQLVGSNEQTPVFNLFTPYIRLFENNQLDCFLITSDRDLGKPEKLRMAYNSRKKMNTWQIESMQVFYSRTPNKYYSFRVEKWAEKNQKINALVVLDGEVPAVSSASDAPSAKSKKMIYYITVITGEHKSASTDAKVYVQLRGSHGETQEHRLYNPAHRNPFERGQMDHFHIFDNNIGKIKSIRIWHDNSGSSPSWLLDTVLVRCIPTSITGVQENHDVELRTQLETLRKKIMLRDLNLVEKVNELARSKVKKQPGFRGRGAAGSASPGRRGGSKDSRARSSSAESTRSTRSNSAPHKEVSNRIGNLDREIKKRSESSRERTPSPTMSILKTSSSPRPPRGRTTPTQEKKQVKFNAKETYHQLEKSDSTDSAAPTNNEPHSSEQKRVDPSNKPTAAELGWLVSIAYDDDANQVLAVKTIEHFDNTIKAIDDKTVNILDSKMKKFQRDKTLDLDEREVVVDGKSDDGASKPDTTASAALEDISNALFVFDCKRWLSRDKDDKKIKRHLKVTNILNLHS